MNLPRKCLAEFAGTAFLLIAVVGSGIMGERLANGNTALVLLANSTATAAALFSLILTFAPISAAHFNPAVSLMFAFCGELPWATAAAYIASQVMGATAGVAVANRMFDLPWLFVSRHARSGTGIWIGEVVATLGLLIVVRFTAKFHPSQVAAAVASYIAGAYWFTSSTSFANPAVTLARTLSDTFAGIRPQDAVAFIAAQVFGMLLALLFSGGLIRGEKTSPVSLHR